MDVVVDTAGADDIDRNARDTFDSALHYDYYLSSRKRVLDQEDSVSVSTDSGYR